MFARQGQQKSFVQAVEGPTHTVLADETLLETAPEVSVVLAAAGREDAARLVLERILTLTLSAYELIVVVRSRASAARNSTDDVLAAYRALARRARGPRSAAAPRKAEEPRLTRVRVVEAGRPFVEARADSLGLRLAAAPFGIVQVDAAVGDYGWDRLLLLPRKAYPDLLAVSGRCAHDVGLDRTGPVHTVRFAGQVGPCALHKFDVQPRQRETAYVRDVAGRGPLLVDIEKLRALGYFAQDSWPVELGADDLCLRAFVEHGWKCSHYPVSFYSDPAWVSWRRNATAPDIFPPGDWKRQQDLIARHGEYLGTGVKHGEERPVTVPHDHRRTVVTASGRKDARALLDLLQDVFRQRSAAGLVVFDLGLDNEAVRVLRSWPQVDLR